MSDPSFAARLRSLADEAPDAPAVTFTGSGECLTIAELVAGAHRLGRSLQSLGATQGSFVTIAEPNGVEFFLGVAACWMIGATPQPVSPRLPESELRAIIELADPAVVLGPPPGIDLGDRPTLPRGSRGDGFDDAPLPDAIAPSWKAPTSGGSTGRPKLIVSGDPSVYTASTAGMGELLGCRAGSVLVMPGPMYHNGPLVWALSALLNGGHVVVLPRFDAEATLAAVEEHRGTVLYLVPTMMQRIWRLDPDDRLAHDLSSIEKAWHLAAPCPPWLKREWIDWLGGERIWELYGGTEGQCFTVLDGNEWIDHPGSVGRAASGELAIFDEDGTPLGPDEIGEVWMRSTGRDRPSYRYIGAEAEVRDGGWECLGDIGKLDADGFLHLTDRRSDMILVGGANIYPAEVEAALDRHPAVRSSAVIGLPDDELGNRVHAIVDAPGGVDADELLRFVADELVRYKMPRSVEFVDAPVRDDAGKVRRSQLRAERLDG